METESQREKRKNNTNLLLTLIFEQTGSAALRGDEALEVE